jgi:hypothetical protein
MKYTIKLSGTSALVMSNNRSVDPLDTLKKEMDKITSKRKKTDADHEELKRVEFMSRLYASDELGPYIPAANLRAMLIAGAKKQKMGTAFKSALYVLGDSKLEYDGPRDIEGMYEAGYAWRVPVKNMGTSTVMRTRPKFEQWACEFDVDADEEVVNKSDIEEALEKARKYVGLGDARTLGYGRFSWSLVSGDV